jgi:hypoxanthine phosphoribosyltransferase
VTDAPGPVAIPAGELAGRVGELAEQLDRRHAGGLVLLPVLPEAAPIAADLLARLTVPAAVEGIRVTALAAGGERAQLERSGAVPVLGRDVVIVSAIVDTGLRLRVAARALLRERPASVAVLALLDRPDRRIADIPLEYVGFTVPDCRFAGYGLGRDPALTALRDLHYRDLASAERARRGHLRIA